MATPAMDHMIREFLKIPLTKEHFERAQAEILQTGTDAAANDPILKTAKTTQTYIKANDPLLKIAKMTKNCIKDIRDRLAYIAERRKQSALEQEQKTIAFATALAERNKVKETEKTTKQGQKTHRIRIEVWRDEVKQLAMVEKNSMPDIAALEQQNAARQIITKRPLESELVFFEDIAGTSSTPINKRIKTAQNDSSPLVAPLISSEKSLPWLSTRTSMADEDVFADDDRHFSHQEILKKNVHDNENNENYEEDYDDAEEEMDRDEYDVNSEVSYGSELTKLEQNLMVEMRMVGIMTLILARHDEAMRAAPAY